MDENGGDIQTPSNVSRICRCIKQSGTDEATGQPISQIIYYNSGVGTATDSLYSRYISGATGAGISEHIREAYSFLCSNYSPGDEIFLLGFSRGAFTARSISSLIRCIGLLTPHGISYFYQIFTDWEFHLKPNWTTSFPSEPWPNRPTVTSPEYLRKLLELELTRPDIPIKCVAVWDTVGSLGIPPSVLMPKPEQQDYTFVDTCVEPNIEFAFQALALDEQRLSYSPTIWEQPDGQEWPRILRQCWFPGVHSDIGGGYEDMDLANLTLAWMISQLDRLLDFDLGHVARQNRISMERHERMGQVVRGWGKGKIHDSMTLFFRLGGTKVRTPGEFEEVDRRTQKSTGRRLQNTNESLHASVRIRMGTEGLGYNDVGRYDSEALKDWTMSAVEDPDAETPVDVHSPAAVVKGKLRHVRWVKASKKGTNEPELSLPEDKLGDLEMRILEAWPELHDKVDSIMPGNHATSMRRSSTFPEEHPHTEGSGVPNVANPGNRGSGESRLRKPHREETI